MSREHPTPWLAYSWLFEVALAEVYASGGLVGVRLARSALGLAVFGAAVLVGAPAGRAEPTA